MSNIVLSSKAFSMEEELQLFAEEWDFTVRKVPEGFVIEPEEMLCIDGINVEEEAKGWRFWREFDATTWEDFLLMHITHHIAAKYGILIEYDLPTGSRLVEPTPEEFETFDDYAEHVVRKEEGWVKEMKKNWIYTHRTKYIR
ncbi:hypothetical protein [Paenibacillus hamazuiensis]|uniref:hypothetical protein n=1 Tax=Paenibacillus hamazuiensis TaxID=2936508 RepID=UPI00200CE7CE|nr:hypothetical protein [Paenibacillus hamazuiensis]